MSIGGGSNSQKSSSSNQSESYNYGSNVWGDQSPYLSDLWVRSQGGLAAGDGGAQGFLNNANANSLQAQNQFSYGSAALGEFLNPGTDPAADAYARNMGQQFNEQFLPALQGDAAVAGGLGGSRQQIGAALGSQRAMQSIGDFTSGLYNDQQNRRLAAAQGIAQIGEGYTANAQNNGALADFARSMPWYSLNQYKGLLGAPVMQDLGGYSKATGTGSGSGSGWNANAGWS